MRRAKEKKRVVAKKSKRRATKATRRVAAKPTKRTAAKKTPAGRVIAVDPAPLETRAVFYDPEAIVDAPEFYETSRALGILTWDLHDHGARPFEQRLQDFLLAFPPHSPTIHLGQALRWGNGRFEAGNRDDLLQRFSGRDWRAGSLHELLSRYGLKAADSPPRPLQSFEPRGMRDVAQLRNTKLRILHGGVDVEPADMDAAKAEYVERQEKLRAAQDVRDARKRMLEELERDGQDPDSKT